MDSKVIEYAGNGITGRVVVTAANVLQGMKRTRLRNARGDMKDQPEEVIIASVFTYPDLVAAARELQISGIEGDPTFDQFCQLPEAFVMPWEEAVYQLNPHWLPQGDDEKKE
jgi:hypothetical protein